MQAEDGSGSNFMTHNLQKIVHYRQPLELHFRPDKHILLAYRRTITAICTEVLNSRRPQADPGCPADAVTVMTACRTVTLQHVQDCYEIYTNKDSNTQQSYQLMLAHLKLILVEFA